MRVLELFAGAGGAALGLERAGFEHAALVEHDPSACATLRAAGLGPVVEGDVRDLDAIEAVVGPSVDMVWASWPCQPWSQAGAGKGAKDDRNGWPWTVAALDRFRPTWFMGENVRGHTMHSKAGHPDPMRCPACYLEQVVLTDLRKRFAHVGYWVLDAADYGIVTPCPLHDSVCPTDVAEFAANASQCATAQVCAAGVATTSSDAAQIHLAVSVVHHSANAMRQACAGNATPDGRRASLLALAQRGQQTMPGRVVDEWIHVGMSACGWTADMSESIGLWLLNYSADHFLQARWSTTSTVTRRTTIRRILRSIEAMAITGPTIGTAPLRVECGLCHDGGVPQHRRRLIVWAGPQPLTPPARTHGPGMFTRPWVTMGQALGLRPGQQSMRTGNRDGGRVPRVVHGPAPTITTHTGHAAPWTKAGEPFIADYLLRPAPTVTATEAKGHTNPHLDRGRGGSVNRASDALFLATGRRRLTVAECAALQGFPADHPWQGTKTAQYRQVGNAVPPALAQVVGRCVLDAAARTR